jgi:hypothetical protein
MRKASRQDELAAPAVIVFGALKGSTAPRACWFRSTLATRAEIAARRLGLSVVIVNSDATRVAAAGLDEGALKPGGRLNAPSVSPKIAANLRELIETAASVTTTTTEMVSTGAQLTSPTWAALKAGDEVLAADLYEGVPGGWWEAVVISINGDFCMLRWASYSDDFPNQPLIRRDRRHIALKFPE